MKLYFFFLHHMDFNPSESQPATLSRPPKVLAGLKFASQSPLQTQCFGGVYYFSSQAAPYFLY